MIKKQVVRSSKGPFALGPYSQGISYQNILFLSAMLPLNEDSELVSDDIKKQTLQVIENLESLLEDYDLDLSHVLKTNVSLTDMDDYSVINQVFAIYFSHPYPARSIVEVNRLPKDAKIQMEFTVAFGGVEIDEEEDYCESCD